MSTSYFLDTNAFILLSGVVPQDLSILSRAITENRIAICMSHVQIDEQSNGEFSDYRLKIEKALKTLSDRGVSIIVEPTIEAVVGVSRLGYARLGNGKLHEIDEALRKEIEECLGDKRKTVLNIASDAIIALSSLNHDFFITADRCLFRSWKIVIESNVENKKAIEQEYQIPEIIHQKKPKGVFEAIMKARDK